MPCRVCTTAAQVQPSKQCPRTYRLHGSHAATHEPDLIDQESYLSALTDLDNHVKIDDLSDDLRNITCSSKLLIPGRAFADDLMGVGFL